MAHNHILEKTSLGERIKEKRIEKGMSQKELGAGRYSKTYLSRVERGQVLPSEGFLQHVAPVLDLPLLEMLSELPMTKFRSRKVSRELHETELMNAHIAVESGQPEKALKHLDKLKLDLLPLDLQAVYYSVLGEAEVKKNQLDVGILDLERGLQMLEANPKSSALRIEQTRNWLGIAYYQQNKHFVALKHHKQCLEAINDGRVKDRTFALKVHTNLANEYAQTGERPQALTLYREAIKLAEEGEDNLNLAAIYWGMGLIYHDDDNLDLAKLYLDKSAKLYESLPETKLAANVKAILGRVLIKRSEYEEAEKALKASLEIGTKAKDDMILWLSHVNLAYLYTEQKKLTEAEQNAESAVAKAKKLKNKDSLGQSLAQLADIRILQGSAEVGLTLYKEAIGYLEQTNARETLSRIFFRYASALEQLGKLSEAIQIFRKAYDYQHKKISSSY